VIALKKNAKESVYLPNIIGKRRWALWGAHL